MIVPNYRKIKNEEIRLKVILKLLLYFPIKNFHYSFYRFKTNFDCENV